MRALFSALVGLSCLLATEGSVHAQARGELIRVVLPFAGGGSGDGLARIIAEQLGVGLNRPTMVELRPGAAGRIGIREVKAAPPDGTTLLISPIAPMTVYQEVYGSLGYDPLKDFRPVSQVASFDFALAIAPNVPAKTVAELVTWLKAHPDQANYGSPGAGTLPHFFGVMFGRAAGVELRHVTYKGGSAAVKDLLGGQIPIVLSSSNEFTELHKSGMLRVLATSGTERSSFLPEIPTVREAGYDIQGTGWFGVFAPGETPHETVTRLSEVLVAGLRKKEVQERLIKLGLQPTGTSPDAFAQIQRADLELWVPVVKASGFKPEQ